MVCRCFIYVAFLFSASTVFAQAINPNDTYTLTEERGPYLGVDPSLKNHAPGKTVKSIQGQQKITWIGFQAQGDRAHVFIQSDQPPIYEVTKSSDDRVLIDFPSATLHTRNDARSLDTGFFPTMVRYVKATQVSRTIVRIVVKLRRPSTGYRVKKDKEMLHFFFNPPKKPIDVLAERERELEEAAKKGQVSEYKEPENNRPSTKKSAPLIPPSTPYTVPPVLKTKPRPSLNP